MDKLVHLHLHTEYSFLDGFSKVWDTAAKEKGALIKRLEELGQPACAITDHGSTAGWVRFDKACKAGGIQPIFGVEGYYCNDRLVRGLSEEEKLKAQRGITGSKEKRAATRNREKELGLSRRSHFCAHAMNEKGLIEIQKTLSIASTEGFYFRPRWDWELMKSMDNCIVTSACAGGIINYHLKVDDFESRDEEKAWEEAKKWKEQFGDRFFIELMAIDWKKQENIDKVIYRIAKDLDIPVIITNDSHYVYPEDWEGHDILLAIQSTRWDKTGNKDILNDPNRMRYDMQDLFVKSRKEMFSSFRKHHKWMPKKEVSEALDRTLEISERCHHDIIKKKMIMPVLKVPERLKGKEKYEKYTKEQRYMLSIVFKGWKKKILPHVKKDQLKTYKKRLNEELKQIFNQGFTPYFILCNDLMQYTDSVGITRGPARGSSAGSLVAYLMDITMIDPIPHKLLFSRFIDPNRTDFPDVDMDFEDVRRHEVVQYFIDKYGSDKVAMLGNNMVFKAKMTLKDVARLYQVNLFETQKICDLVVERSGADSRLSFCLEDTFNQFDFASEYRKKHPEVAKFAGQLEGLTKQQGVHAAGVVIADGDINQYTAVRRFDKNENFRVSYMDKHDAEDIGILKMDILGLNTMGILGEAKKLVVEQGGPDIDLEDICRDVTYKGGDPKVYEAFAAPLTTGIFQFGSPGLTRLSKQMKIDKFSEISDATALHRPGPIHSGAMNQYPAYKFRKIDEANKKSLHPIIDKWTEDTYGLIIYQEQVMQIVRELGGFSWAQTNTVRKVMSKSGGAEYFMKTFWPTWKKNCKKHGLDEKTAMKAFHKIMSFGSWAFNLSHSVSYAMVSYMCMWFKIHYPLEFVTAYLNIVNDTKGDKKQAMIKESERLKIPLREPNVNYSKDKFVIHGDAIICGLIDIKKVGQKAVDTIVENAPYKGMLDFIRRTNSRACNMGAVKSLIMAGAFDDFNYNKKALLERIDDINKNIKKSSDKGTAEAKRLLKESKGKEKFSKQEVMEMKRQVSPIAIGKHIVSYYDEEVAAFGSHVNTIKLEEIELDDGAQVKTGGNRKKRHVFVVGLLTQVDLKRLSQEVKEVIDQTAEKRYALANLEDDTDFCVLTFREEVYERYEQKLHEWRGKVLLISGDVNIGWKKIYVDRVWVMNDIRAGLQKKAELDWHTKGLFKHPIKRAFGKKLASIRKKFKAKKLISAIKDPGLGHHWVIGVVSEFKTLKVRRGDYAGQDMHFVSFEDESYQGSFIVYPSDKRFNAMRKDLKLLYEQKRPFLLKVQRDYKMKLDEMDLRQVSISIDKRQKWIECIRTPFKFKGEKNGKTE